MQNIYFWKTQNQTDPHSLTGDIIHVLVVLSPAKLNIDGLGQRLQSPLQINDLCSRVPPSRRSQVQQQRIHLSEGGGQLRYLVSGPVDHFAGSDNQNRGERVEYHGQLTQWRKENSFIEWFKCSSLVPSTNTVLSNSYKKGKHTFWRLRIDYERRRCCTSFSCQRWPPRTTWDKYRKLRKGPEMKSASPDHVSVFAEIDSYSVRLLALSGDCARLQQQTFLFSLLSSLLLNSILSRKVQ